ncbi:MAG: cob(I)yrinic acid a,c-diamide adenosyltransferase [Dorea sp.]|jgi:cob(I)alamin adenosyltransferase|nr:cob(I)yrinic acid a,c-diamide adenosyltransferase [Dorea sp.]
MADTGKVHVYYGHGKGKTTAAVGQAVRAAGAGLRILFFQFLKDNSSSERMILEKIPGITCVAGKDKVKFYHQMKEEEQIEIKNFYIKKLDEIVKFSDSFDMLILDEALCAVALGALDLDRLLGVLGHDFNGLEVILTGREAPEKVLGIASYATEMKKIKHPFDAGLRARYGIEY